MPSFALRAARVAASASAWICASRRCTVLLAGGVGEARAKADFSAKLIGLLSSHSGLTDELMAGLQAALDAEAARVAAGTPASPEACTAIELGLANIG